MVMDMNIIEAFKKGDRIGAPFEGKGMWLEISEERLHIAFSSTQGTDESSIVDCFIGYIAKYPWKGDMNSWLWGWLIYHQQHHGWGYGKTYRDHFALVRFLAKSRKSLSVADKLAKIREIADEADSFGNACLALVYPLYQYAKANIQDIPAREVVLWFTRHSHCNSDALKAVNRLMDAIDGDRINSPGEEVIRSRHCAENATAWNTLMTAAYISDAQSEEEMYLQGIHVGGDTDSTIATAALLWQLSRQQ